MTWRCPHPLAALPIAAETALTSGVYDLRRQMQRRFLPFLPNDESGTDAQSEAAVSYLSADLQWLLAQDDEQFWDTVLQEQSLQQALDSYLRFKR